MLKSVLSLSALLVSANAFALGPIPNGVYSGKITCSAPSTDPFEIETTITVTDTTLASELDGDVNVKHIVPTDGKNFRVNPDKENGTGYFTEDGLVYEMKINGVPGRDEFRYRNGALEESGSAVYDGETFQCQGVHQRR